MQMDVHAISKLFEEIQKIGDEKHDTQKRME